MGKEFCDGGFVGNVGEKRKGFSFISWQELQNNKENLFASII